MAQARATGFIGRGGGSKIETITEMETLTHRTYNKGSGAFATDAELARALGGMEETVEDEVAEQLPDAINIAVGPAINAAVGAALSEGLNPVNDAIATLQAELDTTQAELNTAEATIVSLQTQIDDIEIPEQSAPYLNMKQISLLDYQSLTTGGTNWSPAVDALIAEMDANNKYGWIPNGDYLCSTAVSKTTTNRIVLEGGYRASLQFHNTNGLGITFSNQFLPPRFEGLVIRTTSTTGVGSGLSIVSPVLTTSPFNGPILEDCRIAGVDINNQGWNTALYMQSCWFPVVKNTEIKGKGSTTASFITGYGMRFHECQSIEVVKPMIQHTTIAIGETGGLYNEGVSIHHGELVGVGTGISLASTAPRLNTSIHDMHINAYDYCISAENMWGGSIHDNLLFRVNYDTDTFTYVRLIGCRHTKVHHNTFRGSDDTVAGDQNGVILNNSHYCHVDHNSFSDWNDGGGTCVVASIGASKNFVTFNTREVASGITAPAAMFINVGGSATNYILGNQPDQPSSSGFGVFAAIS